MSSSNDSDATAASSQPSHSSANSGSVSQRPSNLRSRLSRNAPGSVSGAASERRPMGEVQNLTEVKESLSGRAAQAPAPRPAREPREPRPARPRPVRENQPTAVKPEAESNADEIPLQQSVIDNRSDEKPDGPYGDESRYQNRSRTPREPRRSSSPDVSHSYGRSSRPRSQSDRSSGSRSEPSTPSVATWSATAKVPRPAALAGKPDTEGGLLGRFSRFFKSLFSPATPARASSGRRSSGHSSSSDRRSSSRSQSSRSSSSSSRSSGQRSGSSSRSSRDNRPRSDSSRPRSSSSSSAESRSHNEAEQQPREGSSPNRRRRRRSRSRNSQRSDRPSNEGNSSSSASPSE